MTALILMQLKNYENQKKMKRKSKNTERKTGDIGRFHKKTNKPVFKIKIKS